MPCRLPSPIVAAARGSRRSCLGSYSRLELEQPPGSARALGISFYMPKRVINGTMAPASICMCACYYPSYESFPLLYTGSMPKARSSSKPIFTSTKPPDPCPPSLSVFRSKVTRRKGDTLCPAPRAARLLFSPRPPQGYAYLPLRNTRQALVPIACTQEDAANAASAANADS